MWEDPRSYIPRVQIRNGTWSSGYSGMEWTFKFIKVMWEFKTEDKFFFCREKAVGMHSKYYRMGEDRQLSKEYLEHLKSGYRQVK